MKRYQVVDYRMELQSVVGPVYFESDTIERILEKLPELRLEHPDVPLQIVDIWPERHLIG
jgi:hypothetical protein